MTDKKRKEIENYKITESDIEFYSSIEIFEEILIWINIILAIMISIGLYFIV